MGSRGNWLFDLRAPCLTIQSEFRVDESTDFGLYHLTRGLAAELPARTRGRQHPLHPSGKVVPHRRAVFLLANDSAPNQRGAQSVGLLEVQDLIDFRGPDPGARRDQ